MYRERYGSLPSTLQTAVYRNLNTKCWSLKSNSNWNRGLVVLHSTDVWLANPIPIVRLKGREQVLLNKVRNVHAHITGEYLTEEPADLHTYKCIEVTYNPFKYGFFYDKSLLLPVPIEQQCEAYYAHFTSDFRLYFYSK